MHSPVVKHEHKKSPTVGNFKLNVDAALNSSTNSIGVGEILRDCKGRVLATLSKKIVGNYTPQIAETKALALSLLWAHDFGLTLHEVESDALAVVQSLRNTRQSQLIFGVVANYVYRSANMEAHGLAKHALRLDDECIWMENDPPPIMSVLILDSPN
ncbi:LOW QUALITY PROTEIN: Ribonuclease H-like domain containing protein [Trema orientale]|uniref:Ribonuclease H-like domain containing protein n=1 Tax=Trema orientale TaxID=63057 RepID=A0A2P5EZS1_TREOI|nr:LOW QUALITY PROTEIN: Ribonuclease H-like domain containing protein [Trema orientale]